MDTTPLVSLVGDRNVALNHFILWMADHQRLASFLCGMGPQGENLLKMVVWDGTTGTRWMAHCVIC